MQIVIGLVLAFLLAACGRQPVQAPAQQTAPSFRPAEVLLAPYPLLPKGPMTAEQLEKLKLRPEKLAAPLQVWNYYRGIRGWRLETLPAGTVTANDATGRPWYKADCANRLYVPPACPTCPPAASAAGGGLAAGGGPAGGTTPAKWDWPSFSRFPWWLLPFLALPFLIWGLGRAWENRRRRPVGAVPPAPPDGAQVTRGWRGVFGGVGRQGGPPGTANAVRAAMVGGATATDAAGAAAAATTAAPSPAAAVPVAAVTTVPPSTGAAPAAPTAAPAAPAGTAAPASGPTPTPAPSATAPSVLTVGAAIAALAGQGITDVAQIKANPDGSVSFWATARG